MHKDDIIKQVKSLMKKNDRVINSLGAILDECPTDDEYEKLIEKYDKARGESVGYNRVLNLLGYYDANGKVSGK